MKFLSQEMLDELKKRTETDPATQKTLEGVTIGVVLLVTDCPGNEDRALNVDITDGKLRGLTMQVKPAPSDLRTAAFDQDKYIGKIGGPYSLIGEVLTGKTAVITVLDKLNVEGDFNKLANNLAGVQSVIDVVSALPLVEV